MPSDQQVDHLERAQRALKRCRSDEATLAEVAQAHASIAIAEALVGRVEGDYCDALEEVAGLALDEELSDQQVRRRVYEVADEALSQTTTERNEG